MHSADRLRPLRRSANLRRRKGRRDRAPRERQVRLRLLPNRGRRLRRRPPSLHAAAPPTPRRKSAGRRSKPTAADARARPAQSGGAVDPLPEATLPIQRRVPNLRHNNGLPRLHAGNRQRAARRDGTADTATGVLHPARLSLLEHGRPARPAHDGDPAREPRALAADGVCYERGEDCVHTTVSAVQHPWQGRSRGERCVLPGRRAISVWAE